MSGLKILSSADETLLASDAASAERTAPGAERTGPAAQRAGDRSPVAAELLTPPARAAATPTSGELQSEVLNRVRPGVDFGARYHIESLLGEGGMGAVFRAYDRELNRAVAIKIIRPGLMADPSAVQRFKQELLLGSKISHRNILRIHDLGDVDGLKFISMACVDGEDLHTRLRREGRLPIGESVRIARQVAEALAAAHREGVVHRDLKPHNILLDRSGEAFVSDFGLAKSFDPSAVVTRSGEILGTPRYMAPEQVEGHVVDHRADLYALGLILYEMVTGRVPFHGHSAIQELLERVRVTPPEPRAVNAEVPAPLSDVIMQCLQRDPEARYQSADEILAALAAAHPEGSSARRTPLPSGSRALPRTSSWLARTLAGRRGSWRRARAATIGAAIATALLVGAFAGWRWLGTGSPGRATPPAAAAKTRYLAVLPFRVLGTDERLRYIGDGVVEALSAKLFQVGTIRVASVRDVEQAGSFRSVDDAARKLGANLIVEGTVQSAGNRLRLIVNLHDIAAQRRTWSQEFTGAAEDLFALEDQVFDELRAAIGVSGAPLRDGDVARRPDSLEAYDLYLRGRHALRSHDNPEQIRQAIGFFDRAVEQDAGFALAHTGLADASLMMYRETKDRIWAQRAQASAERARDLSENLPEVHFALGSVYTAVGRHAESVVVLKNAIALAPNSDEAHRRLGVAYRALGREQEGLAELRKAVELNPYFWVNHNALGGGLLQFGKAEEAVAAFTRVTELEPGSAIGYEGLGSALFAMGRWEDCVPAYEKALKLQPHWMTYSNLGAAHFYLGRYQDAVQAFERAVDLNPNDAVSYGNLADALRWSGRADRAAETYRRAMALAYKDLEVNASDANTLGALALYHAKSGDPARARELIQQARAIDSQGVALIYYEAVVHALANRDDQALASLERALEAGYPAREVATDPELRRLSRNPAFQRLVRRYSAKDTSGP